MLDKIKIFGDINEKSKDLISLQLANLQYNYIIELTSTGGSVKNATEIIQLINSVILPISETKDLDF